jgi:hypothetical protein
MNVAAALRAGRMAKYLPHSGWEPWVLTADPALEMRGGPPPSTPYEVDERRVVRTPFLAVQPLMSDAASRAYGPTFTATMRPLVRWTRRLKQLLWNFPWSEIRMPASSIGWSPYAVRAGLELIREQRIDMLYSIGAPHTAHLVARKLQKMTDLPWVAEMGDLWTQHTMHRRKPLWDAWEVPFERWTLRPAARLITGNEFMRERLARLHRQPIDVVADGFDNETHAGFRSPYREVRAHDEPFRIVFTGTFHPGHQDPTSLFHAVRRLRDEGVVSPANFEMVFVGNTLADIERLAARCEVRPFVRVGSYVPYLESLRLQHSASALLVLDIWNDSHQDVLYGKLVDYLGSGRPILSVGPRHGPVDHLLSECRAGVVADTTAAVYDTLRGWLQQARAGQLQWQADARAVERYSCLSQTQRLARLLHEVRERHQS